MFPPLPPKYIKATPSMRGYSFMVKIRSATVFQPMMQKIHFNALVQCKQSLALGESPGSLHLSYAIVKDFHRLRFYIDKQPPLTKRRYLRILDGMEARGDHCGYEIRKKGFNQLFSAAIYSFHTAMSKTKKCNRTHL